MKQMITLFFLVLLFYNSQAQLQIGYHYVITTEDEIFYSVSPGLEVTKSVAPKEIRSRFFQGRGLKAMLSHDKNDPGKIKIDFWGFKNDPYNGQASYVNSADNANAFYLKIPVRTDLSVITTRIIPYRTWELGVTTVPFKFRQKYAANIQREGKADTMFNVPNDVALTINAGLYVGRKWGKTHFYPDGTISSGLAYTLAGFVGPIQIPLSAENTFDKSAVKSNELGVSTGLAIQISKQEFNLGFLAGYDYATSSTAKAWFYDKKLWFGFGVGYKLGILNGGK